MNLLLRTVATVVVGVWAATVCAADPPIADSELPTWLEKKIQQWQPAGAERAFDDIAWTKDIREALRLGKEHNRPVFLFMHKGRMNVGRC